MTVQEQREAVVREALTWLGTPYEPNQRVKKAGCDCATILAEVFATALGWPRIELPYYSPQWHLHHTEEKYLAVVSQYGKEIEGEPQPGDIVVWKFARAFSHGGIVVKWPAVVHSYLGSGTELVNDVELDFRLKFRPMKVFSPWV